MEPEPSLTDELAGLSPRSNASDDIPGRSPRLYADEEDDEASGGGAHPARARKRAAGGGRAGNGGGSEASTPTGPRPASGSTPFDMSLVCVLTNPSNSPEVIRAVLPPAAPSLSPLMCAWCKRRPFIYGRLPVSP